MSSRTYFYAFVNKHGNVVSGSFGNITDADFYQRLDDLGYVEPKWYEFWKSRAIINIYTK